MKISKLIKRLEEIRTNYGELYVGVPIHPDSGEGCGEGGPAAGYEDIAHHSIVDLGGQDLYVCLFGRLTEHLT